MGIDIYARWRNQSEDEEQAQFTGFSLAHGHVGYLRESYGGTPFATHVLVPEAFASDSGQATIPAATLRSRLPGAIATCRERYEGNAEVTETAVKSLEDFVALCERKEEETGEPCVIIASY